VRSAQEEFCEDLLDAMAMGIGDYFEKTGAFRTIGVSLSGGRDSLLSLLVAHRHLTKHLDPISKRRVAGERLRAF
jgi:NAD+ synthase (glutamine-hydrolysing)